MTRKEYYVADVDIWIDVWETKRQKDILDVLDESLEMEKLWIEGCNCVSDPFENDAFYILYNDGSYYCKMSGIEDGVYKKKSIKAIVYNNPCDTWVYGEYEVNEYGVVNCA